MIAWLIRASFKKAILKIFMLMISTLPIGTYSAEFVEAGYRDGLVIETTVNIASFVYAVAERSDDVISYGAGLGYQGNTYSGVFAVSQVLGDINEYKAELQGTYSDGHFVAFAAIGLYTERTDLGYKIGVGYPVNEKLSISTYVSGAGFFIGFRRSL